MLIFAVLLLDGKLTAHSSIEFGLLVMTGLALGGAMPNASAGRASDLIAEATKSHL